MISKTSFRPSALYKRGTKNPPQSGCLGADGPKGWSTAERLREFVGVCWRLLVFEGQALAAAHNVQLLSFARGSVSFISLARSDLEDPWFEAHVSEIFRNSIVTIVLALILCNPLSETYGFLRMEVTGVPCVPCGSQDNVTGLQHLASAAVPTMDTKQASWSRVSSRFFCGIFASIEYVHP